MLSSASWSQVRRLNSASSQKEDQESNAGKGHESS
jgi:hypothetical protein